jgi:fumarate hydratase class I
MPTPLTIDLEDAALELIRRASTVLPPDIRAALQAAQGREEPGSAAEQALGAILQNVEMAEQKSTPICQDTGTLIFHINYPFGYSTADMIEQINKATIRATENAYLRPNAVDSLAGKNSGNNLGIRSPQYHFHEWDKEEILIKLLLKGGGSENVCAQYKLPDTRLKAGRNLEGVRRVVLDAVYAAQGKGCSPGVLGIAVGGDRGAGYMLAKEQLYRSLDDTNPVSELAELEERLLRETNELGIGPMGFGGKTTILGVKIAALHRLPASFFVSIAYLCWAARRASMTIKNGEVAYHA